MASRPTASIVLAESLRIDLATQSKTVILCLFPVLPSSFVHGRTGPEAMHTTWIAGNADAEELSLWFGCAVAGFAVLSGGGGMCLSLMQMSCAENERHHRRRCVLHRGRGAGRLRSDRAGGAVAGNGADRPRAKRPAPENEASARLLRSRFAQHSTNPDFSDATWQGYPTGHAGRKRIRSNFLEYRIWSEPPGGVLGTCSPPAVA